MKRILILAAALFAVGTAFAQSEYNRQRRSLFEVLPVYSSDIVFLGNSITDGCEWAELFNNRHVKNRGIQRGPAHRPFPVRVAVDENLRAERAARQRRVFRQV